MSTQGKPPVQPAKTPRMTEEEEEELKNEAAGEGDEVEEGEETTGDVLGEVTFSITDAVRAQKQHQVKIDGLPEIFARKNLDQATMISARKGNFAELKFKLKDGTTPTLTMGDTHAVWEQHQRTPEQKALFSRIYASVLADKPVALDVVDVTYRGKGKSTTSGGSSSIVKF